MRNIDKQVLIATFASSVPKSPTHVLPIKPVEVVMPMAVMEYQDFSRHYRVEFLTNRLEELRDKILDVKTLPYKTKKAGHLNAKNSNTRRRYARRMHSFIEDFIFVLDRIEDFKTVASILESVKYITAIRLDSKLFNFTTGGYVVVDAKEDRDDVVCVECDGEWRAYYLSNDSDTIDRLSSLKNSLDI